MNRFHIHHCWEGESVEDNLLSWSNKRHPCSHLPLFVLWEVWKARNAAIFSSSVYKPEVIYLKILSSISEWGKKPSPLKGRIHSAPLLQQEKPVDFLNGASKEGVCGASFVIKLNNSRTFRGWLKAGLGSNTQVEVIGLWSLLHCAQI